MPETDDFEVHFNALKTFFEQPVCQEGTRPLRNGVQIALYLDSKGPVTLTKLKDQATVTNEVPAKPDMTFWVPSGAIKTLTALTPKDVGEVGVEILKLMANPEPAFHMSAKVHIGAFDLLRNGYLGVIPLGGPTVMKFLASKGFGSLGKIREALSKLRS